MYLNNQVDTNNLEYWTKKTTDINLFSVNPVSSILTKKKDDGKIKNQIRWKSYV